MGFLFLISVALILYGTFYPFEFTSGPHLFDVVGVLLKSFDERPGRGDVLSNIVLFLPFGFFGMQSLTKVPRVPRLILVTLLGGSLSLAIETTQMYLPERMTSIYDLILNTLGTFMAGLFGLPDWRAQLAKVQAGGRPAALFPLLLGGAWAGYRFFPYVPTIDLQHVKDAIKPLMTAEFPPVDVMRHFVVAIVVARLLQSLLTPRRALLAAIVIPLSAIAAKPFIMTKIINPAEVAGVVAAVIVWVAFLSRVRIRTGLVLALLVAQIAIQGLYPFTLREPVMFSFIPMIGFEGGSMSQNLQAFLEKVFLYGSLVWLTVNVGANLLISVIFSAVFLTGIEICQMYLDGRTSEITDPLLGVLMGIALYFVEKPPRGAVEVSNKAIEGTTAP